MKRKYKTMRRKCTENSRKEYWKIKMKGRKEIKNKENNGKMLRNRNRKRRKQKKNKKE